MKRKIIPFNALVEDTISGFKGIVMARYEYMNKCIRYEIQPLVNPKDPGNLPEGKLVEPERVRVIKLPKSPIQSEYPHAFEFGVKVEDRYVGFVGIITMRIIHKNQGLRYGVEPRVDEKGNQQDIKTFDEEDLVQIDPPPKKKKKKIVKKSPNGPHGQDKLSR
jgi:hypothetical protein